MKKTIMKVLLNIFFIILCFIIFLPLLWIILNSLKTNPEMFKNSLALPEQWQFINYIKA